MWFCKKSQNLGSTRPWPGRRFEPAEKDRVRSKCAEPKQQTIEEVTGTQNPFGLGRLLVAPFSSSPIDTLRHHSNERSCPGSDTEGTRSVCLAKTEYVCLDCSLHYLQWPRKNSHVSSLPKMYESFQQTCTGTEHPTPKRSKMTLLQRQGIVHTSFNFQFTKGTRISLDSHPFSFRFFHPKTSPGKPSARRPLGVFFALFFPSGIPAVIKMANTQETHRNTVAAEILSTRPRPTKTARRGIGSNRDQR